VSSKTLVPDTPLHTLKVLANLNLRTTLNDKLAELSSQFENLIGLGLVTVIHGKDDRTNALEEGLM